jgi:hypothetical protein
LLILPKIGEFFKEEDAPVQNKGSLGRTPAFGGVGLSACIFFACGKKGYRCNPLRCSKTASVPFLSCKFFASQKTYKTIAAGLHAGPLEIRCQARNPP